MNNQPISVRRLGGGGHWYWIDKAVIQQYTPYVGAFGIVVYNYLASMANARNQCCFPSQRRMARALGCSKPTIIKAVKVLEQYGLIRVEKGKRHHHVYHLLRVNGQNIKPLSGQNNSPGWSNKLTSPVKNIDPNNNNRTRINNKMSNTNSFNSNQKDRGFRPAVENELTAIEMARELDDHRNLLAYIDCARKYPQSILKRAFAEAKETPESQIKESRAVLFFQLVQANAAQAANDSGN